MIKLTAEVEVGTGLGVFTVIYLTDVWTLSRLGLLSTPTPRRRVFGTASNGPQSPTRIISNDNTNEMEE